MADCHRMLKSTMNIYTHVVYRHIKQQASTDASLFSSLSHSICCPLRISTVPWIQLALCWPLPTGAHLRVIGQNTDEVQSQPVIMGDVSPGRALRASHKPWKWLAYWLLQPASQTTASHLVVTLQLSEALSCPWLHTGTSGSILVKPS